MPLEITSIMTVDQSTAFDCMEFSLLLDKLRLYSVGEEAIGWIENYLMRRSQFVSIESRIEALSRGVPQGSVLGALLYSVFTNKLTEVV